MCLLSSPHGGSGSEGDLRSLAAMGSRLFGSIEGQPRAPAWSRSSLADKCVPVPSSVCMAGGTSVRLCSTTEERQQQLKPAACS